MISVIFVSQNFEGNQLIVAFPMFLLNFSALVIEVTDLGGLG